MHVNLRKLRIKLKSLAEEARIIRREERLMKLRHERPDQLCQHRRWTVRNEARATLLAYAFLKGLPYDRVERKVKEEVHFRTCIQPKAAAMVKKYGWEASHDDKQLERWYERITVTEQAA